MAEVKIETLPDGRTELVVDARRDQLDHVVEYIHSELKRHNAPKSVYPKLDIACEEWFTNVCSYSYVDATPENPGKVRILCGYEPEPPTLIVQISDDGIPYNPLEKEEAVTVDKFDDFMDVPIGGFGIFLVKLNTESMTYERVDDRSNVITFTKSW